MELKEAIDILEKSVIYSVLYQDLIEAIETVLQALEERDKALQNISDEFLKYDWKNSNQTQTYNQLKSLYNSIFIKEKVEEEQ